MCVCACVCIGRASCGLEGIAGCLSSQSLCLLVHSMSLPHTAHSRSSIYISVDYQSVVICVCQDKKAEH